MGGVHEPDMVKWFHLGRQVTEHVCALFKMLWEQREVVETRSYLLSSLSISASMSC